METVNSLNFIMNEKKKIINIIDWRDLSTNKINVTSVINELNFKNKYYEFYLSIKKFLHSVYKFYPDRNRIFFLIYPDNGFYPDRNTTLFIAVLTNSS